MLAHGADAWYQRTSTATSRRVGSGLARVCPGLALKERLLLENCDTERSDAPISAISLGTCTRPAGQLFPFLPSRFSIVHVQQPPSGLGRTEMPRLGGALRNPPDDRRTIRPVAHPDRSLRFGRVNGLPNGLLRGRESPPYSAKSWMTASMLLPSKSYTNAA